MDYPMQKLQKLDVASKRLMVYREISSRFCATEVVKINSSDLPCRAKSLKFSFMGWVMVPLDTRRVDVSVDKSGFPSYVVFRGNVPVPSDLSDSVDGLHCTLDSKEGEIKSVRKLKGKDLQFLEGPPNEYAKDIVAAGGNVSRIFVDVTSDERMETLRDDSATPEAWKTPVPFFWFNREDRSGALISRDADQIIVMNGKMSSRKEWISSYKAVGKIDLYSVAAFHSMIGGLVTISDAVYEIKRPADEGIFTLVSECQYDITIMRAYYTTGRNHSMTFVFNDGAENHSKGFAVQIG
eukprot:GHVS01065212.1.p1 GENE.GHVS01065212.1~~GHVS01065212.1.p1  ORF type:complete len:295 (+),score=12.93 GHVS01065212.1:23-907(+)